MVTNFKNYLSPYTVNTRAERINNLHCVFLWQFPIYTLKCKISPAALPVKYSRYDS